MKYTQKELEDELMVSCCKYMTCSLCDDEISASGEDDDLNYQLMRKHFVDKHGLKK